VKHVFIRAWSNFAKQAVIISFMSLETEQEFRKRSREAERSRESRESKEAEADPELAAAATLERADYLVKEVKQGKQQMQNILIHMQQVKTAIRQLRQQLQLADGDDSGSVQHDAARVEELKKQVKGYQEELVKMRSDLVREQMSELKNGIGVGLTTAELQARAEGVIDAMIAEVVDM